MSWGAILAQWWEHLSPTSVARVQIPASTPYVGWVCCWFSPFFREVFLRYSGFPLFSKTNISKFQYDQEQGDEEPLSGCATSPNPYLLFISPCKRRCRHCLPIALQLREGVMQDFVAQWCSRLPCRVIDLRIESQLGDVIFFFFSFPLVVFSFGFFPFISYS